jgi:hypothetical protein
VENLKVVLDTAIEMGSTIPKQYQEKYVEGEVAIMRINESEDEVGGSWAQTSTIRTDTGLLNYPVT